MDIQCRVDLGARSYDIHIAQGSLGEFGQALNQLGLNASRCMVFSNITVGPLYLETLCQSLRQAGWEVFSHLLPDGEQYKNLATWGQMLDALMDHQLARNEPVIALGGGVVGDMAGFAAACYRRGVPYVQIPTTLLAQVDSSVGGKTAISHPHGKNMIGAFYQPKLVWIDPQVLRTLEPRQLRAGLAEVIKYGAIWSEAFFTTIHQQSQALLALDESAISQAIARSCRFKADIVAKDETEAGNRALLNLGHTFGHAIEAMTGYTTYLHGEAVAIGMCMAARLSEQLGLAPAGTEQRMVQAIKALELPVAPPSFSATAWLDAMGHDKKNIGTRIRYILMRGIGQAMIAEHVEARHIHTLIASYNDEEQA